MSYKNNKKRTTVGIAVVFLVVSAFFTAFVMNLPSKVHLMQGERHELNIGLPLSAEFSADNIGAININNKAVDGNINISLKDPVSLESETEGEAQVELSLFGVIPVKTVSLEVLPQMEIVPCGRAVGITMETNGVMVLGTGNVNGFDSKKYEPSKGILRTGDLIIKAGNTELATKEDLISAVEKTQGQAVELQVKRNNEEIKVSIVPVKSIEDKKYKIGVWVRDSTQGIGTMTYYNPKTGKFGALGHGIYDVDTKELMAVKTGKVTKSIVAGIKKGEKGIPGEVMGSIDKMYVLGNINVNSEYGIYGDINEEGKEYFNSNQMPIAMQQDVKEGEATIRTDILNGELKDYDVRIESINRYSLNADKGMVIRITDDRLLSATNGIVQGMSGIPIIQNGKVIGAITHVFVQEPSKGYGIFIENMIKEEK